MEWTKTHAGYEFESREHFRSCFQTESRGGKLKRSNFAPKSCFDVAYRNGIYTGTTRAFNPAEEQIATGSTESIRSPHVCQKDFLCCSPPCSRIRISRVRAREDRRYQC